MCPSSYPLLRAADVSSVDSCNSYVPRLSRLRQNCVGAGMRHVQYNGKDVNVHKYTNQGSNVAYQLLRRVRDDLRRVVCFVESGLADVDFFVIGIEAKVSSREVP